MINFQMQCQKKIITSLRQFTEQLHQNYLLTTSSADAFVTGAAWSVASGAASGDCVAGDLSTFNGESRNEGKRVIIGYSGFETNKWNIRISNQLPWLKCPAIPSHSHPSSKLHSLMQVPNLSCDCASKNCCTIMACSRTCTRMQAQLELRVSEVTKRGNQLPNPPKEQYKWGNTIYIPIGYEHNSSEQQLHWYKKCITSINPIEIANDVMGVMDNADDQKQLVINRISREVDILARRMPIMFTYSSGSFQPVLIFNINNAEVSVSKCKPNNNYADNNCIYIPFGFYSDKMTELQIQQHAHDWVKNNVKEKLIAPIIEELEKYWLKC